MKCRCSIMFAVTAQLATTQAMHAQPGRADLRYRAPLPASAVFLTIDSTTSTLSNVPTGGMSTSSFLRSSSELRFSPSQEGVNVTAVLREMVGSVSTPMGDMPMSVTDVAPVELQIDENGADPTYAAADAAPPFPGTSPGDLMGAARAVAGLLAVPGREVEMGETWTDTVRSSRPVGDLESTWSS